MFAVIFEVQPRPEAWDSYLGYAKLLRPELEKTEGFIDNERFSSLHRPGWLLSLSTWRDEKSVIHWRSHAGHHEIQRKGREKVFRDYHLRVGQIILDSHSPAGQSLTEQRLGETATVAKLVALSESTGDELPPEPSAAAVAVRLGAPDPAVADWDLFESIYNPGKFILLASWHDVAPTEAWPPQITDGVRHRRVRVIRDYGMFDRKEAPQYYPPVLRESPGS